MIFTGKTGEYIELVDVTNLNADIIKKTKEGQLSLLWFDSNDNKLTIDAQDYTFNSKEIICLTEFHNIEIKHINKIRFLRFNVPFYCILDHDSEVGCKGILFYGASNFPVLNPNPDDFKAIKLVWEVFLMEMASKDNLQLEMLQMMLKRVLILCTRIYKSQSNYKSIEKPPQVDLVREFNFLVEKHFKTKHTVSEYAELLNKSPKTISNLFKKVSDKTPLQHIQNRKMLEAKRLIRYTDRSISEVGYEIGYEDIQSFSRFFKKQVGVSPTEFREN